MLPFGYNIATFAYIRFLITTELCLNKIRKMKLQHNTILVTGGTSGFGYEFASRLIALGNTVIITGRNMQKLQETQQKLPGVHIIQSDVSKAQDIMSLYEQVTRQFPNLNILINTAGTGVILKSPDGNTCRLMTVSDAGVITLAPVTCP